MTKLFLLAAMFVVSFPCDAMEQKNRGVQIGRIPSLSKKMLLLKSKK
jgi:hypothetical protein